MAALPGLFRTYRSCRQCDTVASYNVPSEMRAVCCKQHATDDMVDVVSRRCARVGCPSQPSYWQKDDPSKRMYCAEHRLPNMVRRWPRKRKPTRTKCQHCPSMATMAFPNELEYAVCKGHASPGMVAIKLPPKPTPKRASRAVPIMQEEDSGEPIIDEALQQDLFH